MTYGGKTYYFEHLEIQVKQRVERTPLVGGGSIKTRIGGSYKIIILKARIRHSDIFTYQTLCESLADGIADIKINYTATYRCTLISGRLTSREGEPLNECEIILTEADE